MKTGRFIAISALVLLLIGVGVTPLCAQVTEEWVAIYNGPLNNADGATSLAVDGSGNVYVTGWSWGIGTNHDYVTVKYNAAGVQQWEARYNGLGNVGDQASCLAVDGNGNVYVSGRSTGNGTGYDYATIKYNAAGVQQWEARYNGPGNGDDEVAGLAVDGGGNVYVTGKSIGSGTDIDYATIKYNATGVQQWIARYNGPGNSWDIGNSLAVDGNGNVYVTGWSVGIAANGDYATIKYNAAGVQQWVVRYNGPANYDDGAYCLTVDANSNVYVTGRSAQTEIYPYNYDYATIKYNTAGVQQWVARYNGPGNSGDEAHSLAVDGNGNVYVTGFCIVSGVYRDYATIKYNATGVQQWEACYNGPGNQLDEPHSLAVDANGNVYVTGYSFGNGTSGDYATIKYNAAGVQQWEMRYNGPSNYEDMATSLAVDGVGNVYVTGYSTGIGWAEDYATIKYSQSVPQSLDVNTSAVNPPVVIPRNGGSFQYNIDIHNLTTSPQTFSVWNKVRNAGNVYTQVWGPVSRALPGGANPSRVLTQTIAGTISSGTLYFISYIGTYPNTVVDSSFFTITKSSIADGNPWVAESNTYGDVFDEFAETNSSVIHNSSLITHNSPNPFNPTTTLSFSLPQAGKVMLKVYDVGGREVAKLVDGWRDAGTHQVTFDATGLTSGVYLYRMTSGNFNAVGKMALLK
ncbi:MAG: SBBP repeat-containing protein [bacterium]|nr:SBBP repeat-containing protein [bacterium]